MRAKPKVATGYDAAVVAQVRSVSLLLATKLGDLLDDLVIVGGLVPSLIVSQDGKTGVGRHAGTMDLDLGLALAIFDHRRYAQLTDRLRNADFAPDQTDKGAIVHQRWALAGPPRVTIDFLIPPTSEDDDGGKLKHLEDDFAAIVTPGLSLAFRDRVEIEILGKVPSGARAARKFGVCGPAAFVVLKALAFRNRGENKDAYDLDYVLQHFGEGIAAIVARLVPLLDDDHVRHALRHLAEDFADIESVGAHAVAAFLADTENDDLRADVVGRSLAVVAGCEGALRK